MAFTVSAAGTYNVLARYEAAYLFETPFQIEIIAGTSVVFSQVYGYRHSLKVQAFGKARLAVVETVILLTSPPSSLLKHPLKGEWSAAE